MNPTTGLPPLHAGDPAVRRRMGLALVEGIAALGAVDHVAAGVADLGDHARLQRDGEYLHGAFYLGSPAFYDWLRQLPDDERRAIGMRRISLINELQRGHESLARLQRQEARFFNSCMMATALGAAVSDGLEDGRVVSGVGGQQPCADTWRQSWDAQSVAPVRTRCRDVQNAERRMLAWVKHQATGSR